MYIERNDYLDAIRKRQWNGRIKVITGLRRSGKSFLLFQMFRDFLIGQGVSERNIIAIALDREENRELTDPGRLYRYLDTETKDSRRKFYILLDEVQYAISKEELKNKDVPPRLYGVLNSLLAKQNVDVYVTGSNSKMLSSDVMTEFRGRGDEIEIYPLSFKEFLPASGKDKEEALNDYLLYGGMPLVLQYETMEEKAGYLSGLFNEIYFKDIQERYNLQKGNLLEDLTDVLCSSAGSIMNFEKLANTVNSIRKNKRNDSISSQTVKTYAGYLEDSFLFSSARRYDIRGKSYFASQEKIYPSDLGLRNARLNFRQIELPRLMENAVYCYLKQNGFLVDVGTIEKSIPDESGKYRRVQYEIDFIVNKGMYQYYIQSAYSVDDEEKLRREVYPFSIVGNSFRKILVTRYSLHPYYDEEGILHLGLADLLLGDYLSS